MAELETTPRPLSARARANREKIFATAIELIAREGYDTVTMADIAKASGVARASVFNHFPAKLAFLAEWFRRFTHEVLAKAREETANSIHARLNSMFEAFGAGCHAHKEIIVHIASLAMGHGPLAAVESELDDDLRGFYLSLIEDGQRQGEVKPDLDAAFLADYFVGLLTVTAHDWVNTGQTSDLAHDLKRRFDLLFSGLEK
ncbi:TetR/AcrR family transcriptional regulator [Maricaulis sp.]|uniref:TetR/AcrR family transcriptional regulator n=1 Tax=Maricaulis sp. TaxID=1486257 RepID=UPI002618ECCD|nr:TetR/AcrR family transcriptional regulator [Maricaulis sp.]